MRVGTLIKYGFDFGIVVGWWTYKLSGEEHALVCWLTGGYAGETDAIMEYDLEVIC